MAFSDSTAANPQAPSARYRRILLTGAAGNLGQQMRSALGAWADAVRLSDIAPIPSGSDNAEIVQADLADPMAVQALVRDVDAIVHFGGISVEAPFDAILAANIVGLNNLYVAAQQQGVRRIVYASSNHVTGFYPVEQTVDPSMPPRPDGLYGVSKCFGEALSRYYYDRFGLETVCLRIGSCFEAPRNPRMLITYLSYADCIAAVRASLFAPHVGHTVLYGVSDNRVKWWDNRGTGHIGFRPSDSSIPFEKVFETVVPPSNAEVRADPTLQYQGGPFVLAGPMAS
jgi:uronate dehydrogenase